MAVSDRGLREAVISWTLPVDEVFRYRIERAESPAGPFVKVEEVAPRKVKFKDAGSHLKDNTAYYYQIVAIVEKEGPESIPSKVVRTVTAPPPGPPAGVKAMSPGSRAVQVSWSPSPTADAVVLYRVERAPASASPVYERVGQVKATTLMDGGTAASILADSSKYLYRVSAINRVGAEGSPSAAVEVTTRPPPAPVQKVAAVSDEVRCVPLSWQPSPEPDIVRYDVFRSRSASGLFEKIGTVPGRMNTSFLDGGANPGTLEDEAVYFYRVRAANAVTAESADSATVRAATRSVPVEVSTVAALGNRPREIPVSWTMSYDQAVVGYEIWRAEEGADDWGQIGKINGRASTNYLDRGQAQARTGLGLLRDGALYQYKVIAFNQAGVRSSASVAAGARTKCRPATPAGLAASTNLPLSVRLVWSPNPEKDIKDYVVECSDRAANGFERLVAVGAAQAGGLSACEMALEPSQKRFYRVKASDREGLESDWCPVIQGMAKPVPDAPTRLQAQAQGLNVAVSWQAPGQPDVRRYKVWRKKFIGWELVSTTEQPGYLFEFNDQSQPMTLAVSAVDADALESEKSESLDIEPGKSSHVGGGAP